MIELVGGASLGFVVGRMLREVAKRLPDHLFERWRIEARDLLALGEDEHRSAAVPHLHQVHILQRWFIPEVVSALLTAIVLATFGWSAQTAAMLVLTWGLIVLVQIDAEHQLLPDIVVYPLLWLGFIANQHGLFASLDDALYGAVAGYLTLWIALTTFRLLAGREGMGHGDLKMLAMLGAWGGWQLLLLIILLASSTAAVYGLAARRYAATESDLQFAFGPFLAMAGFVAIMWGDTIISTYLRLAA